MYLTLRFRDLDEKNHINHGRCGPAIHLKVGFVWFEGPNDLHVQFNGPAGDNCYCRNRDGEFLAPHPESGKITPLYSLEISSECGVESSPAPEGYQQFLESYWLI